MRCTCYNVAMELKELDELIKTADIWYKTKTTFSVFNPFLFKHISDDLLIAIGIVNDYKLCNEDKSLHSDIQKRWVREISNRKLSALSDIKKIRFTCYGNISIVASCLRSKNLLYMRNLNTKSLGVKYILDQITEDSTLILDSTRIVFNLQNKEILNLKVDGSHFEFIKLSNSSTIIFNNNTSRAELNITMQLLYMCHLAKHYASTNIGIDIIKFNRIFNMDQETVISNELYSKIITFLSPDPNITTSVLFMPFLTKEFINTWIQNCKNVQLVDELAGLQKTLSIYYDPADLEIKFNNYRMVGTEELLYLDVTGKLKNECELGDTVELPMLL